VSDAQTARVVDRSDGKWYPPHVQPGYRRPVRSGGGGTKPRRHRGPKRFGGVSEAQHPGGSNDPSWYWVWPWAPVSGEGRGPTNTESPSTRRRRFVIDNARGAVLQFAKLIEPASTASVSRAESDWW